MKKLLINLSLSLVSILITLLICEFIFRFILFNDNEAFSSLRVPSYYSNHIYYENEEYRNDNYWKLNHIFKSKSNIEKPNPLLGWNGFFYEGELDHFEQKKAKGKRPVLLYGDSFAMCVDTVECFEDVLNKDEEFSFSHYLLNYGVGGYGVDQITLLFEETVDKFEKPFVIFSLLTKDMDRSMVSVRDAQKPYFKLEDDELVLKGTPLTLSSKEFFEQNPPEITSYLFNRFRSSDLYPFDRNNEEAGKAYREQAKALNKAILLRAFKKLKQMNSDFVVLIFDGGSAKGDNWRLSFLRNLCHENNIPYFCDTDIKQAVDPTFQDNKKKYTIAGDGHPTSLSNQIVANVLKQYILNPKHRKDILALKKEWLKREPQNELELYMELIKGSPKWLQNVEKQAAEKGISLDSALRGNARYMMSRKVAERKKSIALQKERIKNSPEWLKKVKKQATERKISLDSMLTRSAIFVLDNSK